jgi:hypothetical protein
MAVLIVTVDCSRALITCLKALSLRWALEDQDLASLVAFFRDPKRELTVGRGGGGSILLLLFLPS